MSSQPFFAGVKVVEGDNISGKKLILLSSKPKESGKKKCAVCTRNAKKNGVCCAEHYRIWKENGFNKAGH